MKNTMKSILIILLGQFSFVAVAQNNIVINGIITQDSIVANIQNVNISYSTISASGTAMFSSRSGYVRIV
jgi:hypothetical protein